MSTARESQVGGSHYKDRKIQPIDIIDEYELSFRLGSVVKYVLRDKDATKRVEDLKKARHYLDWEIERLETLDKPERRVDNVFVDTAPPTFLPGWGTPFVPVPGSPTEFDINRYAPSCAQWSEFKQTITTGPQLDLKSSGDSEGPPSEGNSSEELGTLIGADFELITTKSSLQPQAGDEVVMRTNGPDWYEGEQAEITSVCVRDNPAYCTSCSLTFAEANGGGKVDDVSRDEFYIIGLEVSRKVKEQ